MHGSWAYSSHVGEVNATRTRHSDPRSLEDSDPPIPTPPSSRARTPHLHRPELGGLPGQPSRPRRSRGGGRRAAGSGQGRRRRALRGPPSGTGQAPGPRADRAAPRPGHRLPRARPPGGMGHAVHRRGVDDPRYRRGRGGRVPHLGQRPHRAGRCHEPMVLPQERPRRGHRPPEPPAGDQPGGVGRCRPALTGGAVHPRGQGLPGPHPTLGCRPAHRGAGLRQLDRRRCLRPGHERLHRDDRAALEGLPRGPAPGQDGHRRGVDRRGAGRGVHARPPSGWGARS